MMRRTRLCARPCRPEWRVGDVRAEWPSAADQHLVMMVVTGSLNRRPAGQAGPEPARDSPRQRGHDDLVELVIGERLVRGLERAGTPQIALGRDAQRSEVGRHPAEPLPGLRARFLVGGRATVIRRPPCHAGRQAGVRDEHVEAYPARLAAGPGPSPGAGPMPAGDQDRPVLVAVVSAVASSRVRSSRPARLVAPAGAGCPARLSSAASRDLRCGPGDTRGIGGTSSPTIQS